MKLLCIQPDAREAELVRAELARRDLLADLDVVPSLDAARARIDEGRAYDIALVDVNLSDSQSIELLAAIRERKLPMPIIASGGAAGVVAVRALRELGNATASESALHGIHRSDSGAGSHTLCAGAV